MTVAGQDGLIDAGYTPSLGWDAMASHQLARFDQLLAASADAEPGERSEADFALLCFCVRAGLDPEEVWDHVADAGKFAEEGWGYFSRSWRKAVHEVAHENDSLTKTAADSVTLGKVALCACTSWSMRPASAWTRHGPGTRPAG